MATTARRYVHSPPSFAYQKPTLVLTVLLQRRAVNTRYRYPSTPTSQTVEVRANSRGVTGVEEHLGGGGEAKGRAEKSSTNSTPRSGTLLLGGRTAWASVVTVYGRQIQARFWYDGKNLNNAKEDAAETALIWLANDSNLGQGW